MTKNNLIDVVSEGTNGTKKDTEVVVDTVLAAIAAALERGERVDLRGFGSFQVSGKKERQGRNPKTGETMTIAARNVATFKPSKELTSRVNANAKVAAPDLEGEDGIGAQPSDGSMKVHGDKINT